VGGREESAKECALKSKSEVERKREYMSLYVTLCNREREGHDTGKNFRPAYGEINYFLPELFC
jgi:hypothetical protein